MILVFFSVKYGVKGLINEFIRFYFVDLQNQVFLSGTNQRCWIKIWERFQGSKIRPLYFVIYSNDFNDLFIAGECIIVYYMRMILFWNLLVMIFNNNLLSTTRSTINTLQVTYYKVKCIKKCIKKYFFGKYLIINLLGISQLRICRPPPPPSSQFFFRLNEICAMCWI